MTTTVTSIFQDEPTQGLGDGDTPIDAVISSGAAQVRAERSGDGNGRVYYISFKATTTAGGSCTGTVTVAVPHDQAHAAVGDGAKYDSTKASAADGDKCHGESDHGHHDGDGCINGHHGHYDGDDCDGSDGYHHDGDGHGGGRDGGSHRRSRLTRQPRRSLTIASATESSAPRFHGNVRTRTGQRLAASAASSNPSRARPPSFTSRQNVTPRMSSTLSRLERGVMRTPAADASLRATRCVDAAQRDRRG